MGGIGRSLLLSVWVLHCVSSYPVALQIPTTGNHSLDPLSELMNNPNMCGGDMAGGMIGPDCKLPIVSNQFVMSIRYKDQNRFFSVFSL